MEIRAWDERYRAEEWSQDNLTIPANPLLVETANRLLPGKALDLACGSGRNALWLAEQGWNVTAVDGAPSAIEILRRHALKRGLKINRQVADLGAHGSREYKIEASSWDLIVMCFYLQPSLFQPAKQGVRPGGIVLAIVHIAESGQEPTEHQLSPGELEKRFEGWEVLHFHQGLPNDPAHKRIAAEIVARRPLGAFDTTESGTV